MTKPTEMPDGVRRSLMGAAVLVGVTAAGGNFGHVFDFARYGRQGEHMAGIDAALPDVLLVLCLVKLKYDRRSIWAWVGLIAAIGFIVVAGLVTAAGVLADTAPAPVARAVALWPLACAIIAAGLLEARPQKKSRAESHTTRVAASSPRSNSNPGSVAASKPPAATPRTTAGTVAGPETPAPGRPLHLAGTADQPADELLDTARTVLADLARTGQRTNRDNLVAGIRATGRTCSNERGSALLRQLREGAA